MALKNREGKENREYWEFVERTARKVEQERPSWAREAESRACSEPACSSDSRHAKPADIHQAK